MIDIDFILKETNEKDIDLFLGPVSKGQKQIYFENRDNLLLAHFIYEAGIMKSISEARKNGWNKPIPKGYSEFFIGKKKSRITILNIVEII
jgi:hypothetical protein